MRQARLVSFPAEGLVLSEAVLSPKALKGVQIKIVAVAIRRKLDDKVFAYNASNQLARECFQNLEIFERSVDNGGLF